MNFIESTAFLGLESPQKIPASTNNSGLRELLFPSIDPAALCNAIEARYPKRILPNGAAVTRFAPSPTGFLHIGGIYVALINYLHARATGGAFYVRMEDTDGKRKVVGAVEQILKGLSRFGITPAEGPKLDREVGLTESGEYGPYTQTARKSDYRAFVASLMERGLAYPCFASESDLEVARAEQSALKLRPGYYGRWAKWRDASLAAVSEALVAGMPYVIRLRSPGNANEIVRCKDLVKGTITLPQNDTDIVLLKSDGIPTYHLAHVVDDHLMQTTHVLRADEWISSLPVHLQLFETFGWRPPQYGHLPPIQKIETKQRLSKSGGTESYESRRKLSKRSDPEASVDFYHQSGFPELAVVEYLLNIADSQFEKWRRDNPAVAWQDFPFAADRMPRSGALCDSAKLTSVSRETLSRLSAEDLYRIARSWSETFDPELAEKFAENPQLTMRAMRIDRGGSRPNKRLETLRDLREQLGWYFDSIYSQIQFFPFPHHVSEAVRGQILLEYLKRNPSVEDREEWFNACRAIAREVGFCDDLRTYRSSPGAYPGHVGDVTMVLRVAIAGRENTPDLVEVIKVLGAECVARRIQQRIPPF